jgi:3-dehydroquinate synthase
MNEPNIIITGFMGTGKTAVGQAVAERLGRVFIDMDEIIEQRAGKSIQAIFEEDGEAEFRRMEADLCRELAAERDIVVATGGGALVSQANREVLAHGGVLICLTAAPKDIHRRLQATGDRPLLSVPDRQQRIIELLRQRAAAYEAIPHQIDTGTLGIEEVAEQVIRLARRHGTDPNRVPVHYPGGSYEILIAPGLLMETGFLVAEAGLRPGACAVVTNPPIGKAHAQQLADGLSEVGFEPTMIEIPEGEAHKTLDVVAGLYDRFLAARLDRHSPVIALGGGVVGDVAGFAAASYLRGVPFVQVPTSLLAMVDASVGGKTGVDLPQGKNLVGAFKQPALVVVDPEVLKTLPALEFRSGLAEVVKHGIIGDRDLFEHLEGHQKLELVDLITRAIQVKVNVVEADPFERGQRAVLNLGHTFAHALEVLSQYRLRHGEAVSIGLLAACRLANRLELCDPSLAQRVEGLLTGLELPVRYIGPEPDQVVEAMATDKKRSGKRLRFVLPRALGDVDIFEDVPISAVLATLAELRTDTGVHGHT